MYPEQLPRLPPGSGAVIMPCAGQQQNGAAGRGKNGSTLPSHTPAARQRMDQEPIGCSFFPIRRICPVFRIMPGQQLRECGSRRIIGRHCCTIQCNVDRGSRQPANGRLRFIISSNSALIQMPGMTERVGDVGVPSSNGKRGKHRRVARHQEDRTTYNWIVTAVVLVSVTLSSFT